MLHNSSSKFEKQKYFENQSEFNGTYSKNNLPKIKNGAHVINLDEFKPIETHCIAWHVTGNNVIYFDSFEIEHIPKEVKKFLRNKNIITNIYRIKAYNSIMCEYICIRFIDFMLTIKSVLDYTNLFSLREYEKNDKIILKNF